jgi:hypothetical protein
MWEVGGGRRERVASPVSSMAANVKFITFLGSVSSFTALKRTHNQTVNYQKKKHQERKLSAGKNRSGQSIIRK